MKPFAYTRVVDQQAAILTVNSEPTAKYIAGGTNLVDLMKENIEAPARVVDISRLNLGEIAEHEGGVRLPAVATNAETANHPLVRSNYPILAQAILAGASPQLRNAATNGGNLMQRTRCSYFYEVALACNKRNPGTGCSALEGFNRNHAIFGGSAHCIATNPSDMSVALAALKATVQVEGPRGVRSIPVREFHRLPGETPEMDTNLMRDELITAIDLPASSALFAAHSYYLKIRDRASFAFALVSVAAALEMDKGRIRRASVCLGGVAHKPWVAREAELMLAGARADRDSFQGAAEATVKEARPRQYNAFKVELVRRAMVRALTVAAGGEA